MYLFINELDFIYLNFKFLIIRSFKIKNIFLKFSFSLYYLIPVF